MLGALYVPWAVLGMRAAEVERSAISALEGLIVDFHNLSVSWTGMWLNTHFIGKEMETQSSMTSPDITQVVSGRTETFYLASLIRESIMYELFFFKLSFSVGQQLEFIYC